MKRVWTYSTGDQHKTLGTSFRDFPRAAETDPIPLLPPVYEQGILVIQSSSGGRHGETVDCKCSELWKAKRVGDIPKFI